MAKTAKTRKQLLKDPDQFITFSGKLIAFGRSNSKTLLIGAGIVVALVLRDWQAERRQDVFLPMLLLLLDI